MEYMTLKEANKKWGFSVQQINYYYVKIHILGIVKMASVWLLSQKADKTEDKR